jgi:hypothetical protein
MNINYFMIMEAADKEMVHSAMLRFLLNTVPPVRDLFCPFEGGEGLNICLEKNYKKPKKLRIDLEAYSRDEKHLLVVENKFKSIPSSEQLEKYNKLYAQKEFKDKTVTKFLLCFDAPVAILQGWTVLTYRVLRDAIRQWLAEVCNTTQADARTFCRHYAEYLEAYYTTYNKVFADYSLAIPEAGPKNKKTGIPGKGIELAGVTDPASSPNFWCKLALWHVGNVIIEKSGMEVEFNLGSTITPVIDIIPPGWNRPDSFLLCIEVQGVEVKLYIKGIRKNAKLPESAVTYALKLQKHLPEAGKTKEKAMRARAGNRKTKTFAVYKEKALAGSVPVSELPELILDFYRRMDAAVQSAH